jgi:antitoxin component YwqK of YwqJK toxin-antitoxin module
MKRILFLLIALSSLSCSAQSLQTIKTYYDPYYKTKLYETYSVIANTPTKQGTYKAYDAQGILVKEATYVNGLVNGDYKEYYSSDFEPAYRGKLSLSETYKMGVLEGGSSEYGYNAGVRYVVRTVTRAAGTITGETNYFDNGKKANERNYKIGSYTSWYPDGKKESTGEYDRQLKDQKVGRWFYYDARGPLVRIEQYDSNGTPQAAKYFGEKGVLVDSIILVADGVYLQTLYDSVSGIKKEEVHLKLTNALGNKFSFYEEGLYTSYYPNGKVNEVANYKDCKFEGKYTVYFEDNKVQQTVMFHHGVRFGPHDIYDESGALLSHHEYDESGKQIK